ncbi:transposase [Burkholderia cepacia]|uniref:transposase n=1 Tax=Burkholderia cepacia TaxID=292 RepID=UPI0039BFCB86
MWIVEGCSREAIRPFFQWLGAERCRRIEAVAMDMDIAFDLKVELHCPKPRIVNNLYHGIAKYARKVID